MENQPRKTTDKYNQWEYFSKAQTVFKLQTRMYSGKAMSYNAFNSSAMEEAHCKLESRSKSFKTHTPVF